MGDPDASASAKLQQQALCLRIQTYKEILKLSQDHIGLDSAYMMSIVAQSFLGQQKQSFNTSAINEQVFSVSTTLKNG